MGNDESHFNVSLIVRDKVTRQLSIDQNLFEEALLLTARPNRLTGYHLHLYVVVSTLDGAMINQKNVMQPAVLLQRDEYAVLLWYKSTRWVRVHFFPLQTTLVCKRL